MKKPRLFWILLVVAFTTQAQYIENVSIVQRPNSEGKIMVYIRYDLVGGSQIPFNVTVNFKTRGSEFQLKKIAGQQGNLIYAGKGKEIVWDYEDELVHFSGSVDLTVIARPNIETSAKVKRGKALTVRIDPILQEGKSYTIELFRKGVSITTLGDITNEKRSQSLIIPSASKPRKNYQLKISHGDQVYYSDGFRIKPKVSNALKVLAATGAATVIILKVTAPKAESPLPGAPTF